MRMVGHRQGLVHRRYKPQSKRWMTAPKRAKFSVEKVVIVLEMCAALFAMIMAMGFMWLYFC